MDERRGLPCCTVWSCSMAQASVVTIESITVVCSSTCTACKTLVPSVAGGGCLTDHRAPTSELSVSPFGHTRRCGDKRKQPVQRRMPFGSPDPNTDMDKMDDALVMGAPHRRWMICSRALSWFLR